jgi:hypothetical protein
MSFTVVLPPDIIARAHATSEERPRTIKHHKPAAHPEGEIAGAISEHAWAYYYKLGPDSVKSDGGPYGHGDGGMDFIMHGLTVDIKSSPVHPWSWVVGAGPIRCDWFVFAHVILPDTVIFQAKAPGWFIKPFGLVEKVGNKRLVGYEELNEEWRDITPADFKKQGTQKLRKLVQGFDRTDKEQ